MCRPRHLINSKARPLLVRTSKGSKEHTSIKQWGPAGPQQQGANVAAQSLQGLPIVIPLEGASRASQVPHILAYAILKPTNGRRNSGKRGGEAEKLRQEIPNAVGGHRKSGGVVRSRWRAVRQGIWPGIRPGVQRGVIPGLQGCSKQQARQCPKGATGSTRAVGPTRGAGSRGAGSTRGSVSGCPCSNEAVPRTCNCPGATTISDAA